MTKITFYSKPKCPNCVTMKRALDRWSKDTEDEHEIHEVQISDNPEIIDRSGALSAPIVEIVFDGEEDYTRYVSGLNPDLLVDTLNRDEDIWEM